MQHPRPLPLIIFLHIHKTAGTTLNRHIVDRVYAPEQRLYVHGTFDLAACAARYRQQPHPERTRYIAGHIAYGLHEHLDRPCTYFTMLREPQRRVFSLYHFIRQTDLGQTYLKNHGLTLDNVRDLSLAEFAESGLFMAVDNGQTRVLSGAGTAVPYGELTGDHLALAKRCLAEEMDVIGLTERFDETLLLLERAYEWPRLYYTGTNRNAKKPSFRDAPTEGKRAIEAHNELDLELYRYAEACFEEKVQASADWLPGALQRFRVVNTKVYRPYRKACTYLRSLRRALSS